MSVPLLSETHPSIWRDALRFPFGLHAIDVPGEKQPLLILKVDHRYVLTARMNRGFKVYVVPLEASGITTIGLVTAFFDDPDCPLFVWTLLAEDVTSHVLMKTLLMGRITVRLFDEHSRELLGYECVVETPLMARVRLEHAKLHPTAQGILRQFGEDRQQTITHEIDHELREAAYLWFSVRNQEDDADAISVVFQAPLYREDRLFKDERPDLYAFHGSKGIIEVPLVKLAPGQFQEIDIILLLQRIFRPEQIYHSPRRQENNDEIADVVVISDDVCLLVQAKDSPNTEEMLGNSLERKRRKSLKKLDEGCIQAVGAINYLRRTQPLVMCVEGREHVVDLGDRSILTLIVVRELFPEDYGDYSSSLIQLHDKIRLPCVALDYGELVQYTSYCDSESSLVSAYFQVFNAGLAGGNFPRLRFGIRDLFRSDGMFKFD